jgi:hypothetical protein
MLRIVPHTVPRVGRSYEHFPDGFELHLLPLCSRGTHRGALERGVALVVWRAIHLGQGVGFRV